FGGRGLRHEASWRAPAIMACAAARPAAALPASRGPRGRLCAGAPGRLALFQERGHAFAGFVGAADRRDALDRIRDQRRVDRPAESRTRGLLACTAPGPLAHRARQIAMVSCARLSGATT